MKKILIQIMLLIVFIGCSEKTKEKVTPKHTITVKDTLIKKSNIDTKTISKKNVINLPFIDSIGLIVEKRKLNLNDWKKYRLDKIEKYNTSFNYFISDINFKNRKAVLVTRTYIEENIHWLVLMDNNKMQSYIQTAYDNSEGFLSIQSKITSENILIKEWNDFLEQSYTEKQYTIKNNKFEIVKSNPPKKLILNDETKKSLKTTILKVIEAFKDKNAIALNQLIDKKTGLYITFRPGTMDHYLKVNTIDFNNPIPKYLPYSASDYNTILFEKQPTFDCATMEWDKKGLYCDIDFQNHLLSQIAENLNEYANANISDNEIIKMKNLEKNTKQIIATDEDLIFHLTLINNKWHLTVIDRSTTDCSA